MTSYMLSACGCCVSVTRYMRYLLPGTSPVSHKSVAANNNVDFDDGRYVVCDLMEIYRNEPSLATGNSQVIRSGQFTAEVTEEPTSPSKSSTDELDNCIKTNYVASRILNFEGISDVDPTQLKKTPSKLSTYRKVNGLDPRRRNGDKADLNGSAGDGSHVVIPTGKSSKTNDFRLQNGLVECEGLCQTNGFDNRCEETPDRRCSNAIRCDQASIGNGAISHRDNDGSDPVTRTAPHPVTNNGSSSGVDDFQQTELVAVPESVEPKQNGCQDSSTSTSNNIKKDGSYYLEIVDQEEQHLQVTVKQMQDLLESDPNIPEEASGLIRAAVGKSNLLIRKKFTHYRDCCMKNLHPDPAETRQTTDADLAGLWDIVCIQISDISAMFEQIETLRKNAWKTEKVEPVTKQSAKTNSVKTTRKAKTTANKDTTKECKASKARDEARAKAREEAKRRLLAAKKAGRQRKASQSDDVEIYVPG